MSFRAVISKRAFALGLVFISAAFLGCYTYVVRITATSRTDDSPILPADLDRAARVVEDVASVASDPTFCERLGLSAGDGQIVTMCTIEHSSLTTRDRTRIWLHVDENRKSMTFWIRDFLHDQETDLTALLRRTLHRRLESEFPSYSITINTNRQFTPG
jgi:hypothetical protein